MRNVLVITLRNGKVLYDPYSTEEEAGEALNEAFRTIAFQMSQPAVITKSGKVSFASDQYSHAELREAEDFEAV